MLSWIIVYTARYSEKNHMRMFSKHNSDNKAWLTTATWVLDNTNNLPSRKCMWWYVHSIIAISKTWFSTYVIIDEIPYYNNLQNHRIHILGENITVRQFDILGNKTPLLLQSILNKECLRLLFMVPCESLLKGIFLSISFKIYTTDLNEL